MDHDTIVRLCLDNDFDSALIDKELDKFRTDKKYEGLDQFEWNGV